MRWIPLFFLLAVLGISHKALAAGLSFVDGTNSDRAVITITDGGMQRYVYDGASWIEEFGQVIWWHESVAEMTCLEVSPTQFDPVNILCKDSIGSPWYHIGTLPSWLSSTHITLGGDGTRVIIDALVDDGLGRKQWWSYNGFNWTLVFTGGLPLSAQIDSQGDMACVSGYYPGAPGMRYWCDRTGARRTVPPRLMTVGAGGAMPRQPIVSADNVAIFWADFGAGTSGWYVIDANDQLLPTTTLPGHYYQAVSDSIGGIVWHGPTGLWQWDDVADVSTPIPLAPNQGVWLDQNLGGVWAVLLTNSWPVVFTAPSQVWP